MIKPTIGRIVHFRENVDKISADQEQPNAGIIVFVHNDRLVNLTVFSSTGQQWPLLRVPLVQPGDEKPPEGEYCEWMPFQIGQAAAQQPPQPELPLGVGEITDGKA